MTIVYWSVNCVSLAGPCENMTVYGDCCCCVWGLEGRRAAAVRVPCWNSGALPYLATGHCGSTQYSLGDHPVNITQNRVPGGPQLARPANTSNTTCSSEKLGLAAIQQPSCYVTFTRTGWLDSGQYFLHYHPSQLLHLLLIDMKSSVSTSQLLFLQ